MRSFRTRRRRRSSTNTAKKVEENIRRRSLMRVLTGLKAGAGGGGPGHGGPGQHFQYSNVDPHQTFRMFFVRQSRCRCSSSAFSSSRTALIHSPCSSVVMTKSRADSALTGLTSVAMACLPGLARTVKWLENARKILPLNTTSWYLSRRSRRAQRRR